MKYLFNFTTFFLLIVFGLVVYFLPHIFLPPLAAFLVKDDPPQKAECAVILLGGDGPDRVLKAYELYSRDWTKKLVLGSGYVDRSSMESAPKTLLWAPPSARYVIALESLGVPEKDILVVPSENGVDTEGELRAVAENLRDKNLKSVLLVSSPTHTRRVSMIWGRIAPDIPATTVSPRPRDIDIWWRDTALTRSVGYEYGALVKEFYRQARSLVVID